MPPEIAKLVKDYQSNIPSSSLNIKEGGLEDRPHVTILYGLEDQNAENVQKIFNNFGTVTVWLGKVKAFLASETGKATDILYVEVLGREVDILHLLVSAYLPSVSTNPFFKPHMTIAYLNPGEATSFIGCDCFEEQSVIVDKMEFADVNEDFTAVNLSEEITIDGAYYARVPEWVRPLSGSIAAMFGYKIRDGKGWVPKKRLDSLLVLAKDLRQENK
jgi:hypothetical protein